LMLYCDYDYGAFWWWQMIWIHVDD
jgi:hypothetical protein